MADPVELLLLDTPLVRVGRRSRFLLAQLKAPAQVLSTCARNGGLRSDLTALVNHQSCEGARHEAQAQFILGLGPEGYQAEVCREVGLEPTTTAVLGTAASMQYVGVAQRSCGELAVQAVVTAGVQGNAATAGDIAHYDEREGKWVRLGAEGVAGTHAGTINTFLFIDSALTAAALTRALATATEAKSAALWRLAVGSKSGPSLATGTGTDQFALVARPATVSARTWSGQHTKLGQLIGETVIEATLEALRWQNGLEASMTRSLVHALGRFGVREAELRAAVMAEFPEGAARGFVDANFTAVLHEPQTAATAYALAAVLDRVQAGTLSPAAGAEAGQTQLALLAEALSARSLELGAARRALAQRWPGGLELSAVPTAVAVALAMGFRGKWSRTV